MSRYLSTAYYLRGLEGETAQAVSPSAGPRVPPALLTALAEGGSTSEWLAEEIAAGVAGLAVVAERIEDAEREADSYLVVAEPLPISAERVAASPLPGHVRALARLGVNRFRGELSRDNPIRLDAERALRWLERVADGKAALVTEDGKVTDPPATGWKSRSPAGRINWGDY
jgi:phage gp36-like protein